MWCNVMSQMFAVDRNHVYCIKNWHNHAKQINARHVTDRKEQKNLILFFKKR